MIKKIFYFSIFGFFAFISFSTNVSANVHTGISYDAHDRFNMFYEIKENTPMANLLLSKDIKSLKSFLGVQLDDSLRVSISYKSEVSDFLLDGKSLPSEAKYIIFYSDSYYNDGGVLFINKDGSTYQDKSRYTFGTYFDFILLDSEGKRIKFDDSFSHYVTSYFHSNLDVNAFSYDFNGKSKEDMEQFSYFISHFWYYDDINYTGIFDTIYVTDVLYDDDRLLIDDSEVNKNIFTKLKETWLGLIKSDSLIDASQLNLTYFQKNNYMTDIEKAKSLYHILNYENTVVPPDGFTSLNYKTSDNRYVDAYFFIPKNVDTSLNRNLFGYTADLPRKSFANDDNISIKQGVQAFSISDKNKLKVLSDEYVDYFIEYKQNFKLQDIQYKQRLSKIYPDFNSVSSVISVSHAVKYDSVLYYNPKAFDVCPLYATGTTTDSSTGATISTYSSCSFINPVNGEKISLSGEQFYNLASSANGVGASTNIFDSAESQREMADKYGELYEKDENGNVTGFSLTNVLKQLKSFLKNFINVISTIFSSFTMFFNALPVEIRGLLYFSLLGGVILLFWKLIR